MRQVLIVISMIVLTTLGLQAQSLVPIGKVGFEQVLVTESVNQELYAISYDDRDNEYSLYFYDLITWTKLSDLPSLPKEGKTIDGEFHLKDLKYFKGELYLCGAYDYEVGKVHKNIALKWDGKNWIDISDATIQNSVQITKYLIYNDQITLVGIFTQTNLVNLLTLKNGNWSPLGDFGTYDLSEDDLKDAYIFKGKIYASGVFSRPGTLGKRYLMSFDEGLWSYNINPPFLHQNSKFAIHKNHLVLTGTPNAPTISDYDYFKRTNGVGSSWETYSDGLKGIKIFEVNSLESDGKNLWATGKFYDKNNKDTFYLLYNKYDQWFKAETPLKSVQKVSSWDKKAILHGDFNIYGLKSIAQLGEGYAYVQGQIFHDLDENCFFDENEPGVALPELILEPGNYHFQPNSDGTYSFSVPKGSYALNLESGPFWSNSCGDKVLFNVDKNTNQGNINFGLKKEIGVVDLDVFLHSFKGKKVKPGSTERFILSITNSGHKDVSDFGVQIRITPKDVNATFSIPPTSFVDGLAIWDIDALEEGKSQNIEILVDVPKNETEFNLSYQLLLDETHGDIISDNNKDSIVFSTYFQEKSVLKTITNGDNLPIETKELDYDIYFQNTSGSEVNKIIVIDTLDEDIRMLHNMSRSWPQHKEWIRENTWLPEENRFQRVFTWIYDEAALPDSSVDQHKSIGHISYQIQIAGGSLKKHMQICNEAQIFIESFEPIMTNEVCSGVDIVSVSKVSLKGLSIYPNPSNGSISINNSFQEERSMTIMSSDGQMVKTIEIEAFKLNSINLTDLSKGVYIISTPGYKAYKLILQ